MLTAAIVGATGYTGFELAKILTDHPQVKLGLATSESFVGQQLSDVYPQAPAITLVSANDADFSQIDVVFLCLPHAAAAPTAARALAAGARVIDLSADFRLRDPEVYAAWYGIEHPHPELIKEAVYGLTEFYRQPLRETDLVATPGCYPTSVLLGIQPLLNEGLFNGTIIADSKSGVSGAGRKPTMTTHFVEAADNFSPYKIGQAHRHVPEMVQQMKDWHPDAPALIFSPHLLPVPRGILSTIYVSLPAGHQQTTASIGALYEKSYDQEPFIQVLPAGKLSTLAHVNHTNRCSIGFHLAGDTVIITSAIDNLQKGAAGQAVQNMNVMYGFLETAGLRQ